jgi:hypothetical protein
MHKYNMKVKVDHMFGLPNEPLSAQESALKLYANNHIQRIQTFWTCFLPGTQLMNEAIANETINSKQIDDINEGRDFYFFRNLDNIKDKNLQDQYHAYEFIFKLMPIIPVNFRKKIQAKNVVYIPNFLKSTLSFIGDIFIGLNSINPEFLAYLNHNIFHLLRFFGKKIGINNFKATKFKSKL